MQQINRDDLRALLDAGTVTLVEALPGDLTPELGAELAPDPARTVVTYCSGPSCGRSTAAAGVPFYGTRAVSKAA